MGAEPPQSRSAAPKRLRFTADRRLRSKRQFDAVYARGRRFGDGFFAAVFQSNDVGYARLGLAVAVKTAGNSVQRNRLRRLIRESFRLRQHELPQVDLIVSARARVRGASAETLRASLEALMEKVKDQCASSP